MSFNCPLQIENLLVRDYEYVSQPFFRILFYFLEQKNKEMYLTIKKKGAFRKHLLVVFDYFYLFFKSYIYILKNNYINIYNN